MRPYLFVLSGVFLANQSHTPRTLWKSCSIIKWLALWRSTTGRRTGLSASLHNALGELILLLYDAWPGQAKKKPREASSTVAEGDHCREQG